MRTSMQLFDDCGRAVHEFHSQFTLADADGNNPATPKTVIGGIVAEGRIIAEKQIDFRKFLQVVEQPFSITTRDRVYLNADCAYGDDIMQAIGREVGTEFGLSESLPVECLPVELLPVKFARVLPTQLDGLGLRLDAAARAKFSFGYPIWCRGALTSKPGRGQDGYSAITGALRDAIQAWTVIGEQIIRHALFQMKQDGSAFVYNGRNLTDTAEELIGCVLGYDELARPFDISVPDLGIMQLALEAFHYKTTDREARRLLFPAGEDREADPGEDREADPGEEPGDAPANRAHRRIVRSPLLYRDPPDVISAAINREIDEFDRLHHDLLFDGRAVAAWAAKILLYLRVAHTASLSVDKWRSKARERLLVANDLKDAAARKRVRDGNKLKRPSARKRQRKVNNKAFLEGLKNLGYLEGLFASMRVHALTGNNARGETTHLGLDQLLGAQEAVAIALLADIEPRVLSVDLCNFERATQDALFEMARWLGKLYRNRYAIMNRCQAQMLTYLVSDEAAGNDDKAELGHCVDTMLSFLTVVGRKELMEGVAEILRDGLTRSVVAEDATIPQAQSESCTGAISNLAKLSTGSLLEMPPPIIVRAGRLFLPGDYQTAWYRKHVSLLAALKKNG